MSKLSNAIGALRMGLVEAINASGLPPRVVRGTFALRLLKTMKRVGQQNSWGRVKGAKSPLRVQSTSFSNFFKVRKTASAGRKDFFAPLRRGICRA